MENVRDEDQLEEVRTSARRASAKGERAAEAAAQQAKRAADGVAETAGETAATMRAAGENAYEEVSDAFSGGSDDIAQGLRSAWEATADFARGGWDVTKAEIERRPMRSVVIALAAGFVLGGILASRD